MATKTKKVLIVEDNQEIRDLLRELLEISGYEVVLAGNGQEALDVLHRREHPCVILLDLMMPVMTGWDFLRELRNDDILSHLPVVVVSAYDDRVPDEQVQALLKKPVDLDLLLSHVAAHCGAC